MISLVVNFTRNFTNKPIHRLFTHHLSERGFSLMRWVNITTWADHSVYRYPC